jgi:hypothetical protein
LESNLCETRYRITTALRHLFDLLEDKSVEILARGLGNADYQDGSAGGGDCLKHAQ